MKKLLVLLLAVSLFSGCQKKDDVKENIKYECYKFESGVTIKDVLIFASDYEEFVEGYYSVSLDLITEELAKDYVNGYKKAMDEEISMDGTVVTITGKYNPIASVDEALKWIEYLESEGSTCEVVK